MAHRTDMPIVYAGELIDGVASDIGPVRVASVDDLLRYRYRVASTVGLMICHLLNVYAPEARAFAIDLGIAMQLVNIARDRFEPHPLPQKRVVRRQRGAGWRPFVRRTSP